MTETKDLRGRLADLAHDTFVDLTDQLRDPSDDVDGYNTEDQENYVTTLLFELALKAARESRESLGRVWSGAEPDVSLR